MLQAALSDICPAMGSQLVRHRPQPGGPQRISGGVSRARKPMSLQGGRKVTMRVRVEGMGKRMA